MTAKRKKTETEKVKEYLRNPTLPNREVVEVLRTIFLRADPEIREQIKWNSLSYYYTGEMPDFDPKTYKRDLVVFNLHKPDRVLLVFPTGADIKDESHILEGVFSDRRKTITFNTVEQVFSKKEDLLILIKNWLVQIKK